MTFLLLRLAWALPVSFPYWPSSISTLPKIGHFVWESFQHFGIKYMKLNKPRAQIPWPLTNPLSLFAFSFLLFSFFFSADRYLCDTQSCG